jgi:hypothetical protein
MGQRRERRSDRGGKINGTEESWRMTRGLQGKGERVADAEESRKV